MMSRVVKHLNRFPRGVENASSMPGHIQSQVTWGSEQSNLVEDTLDHCRSIGPNGL